MQHIGSFLYGFTFEKGIKREQNQFAWMFGILQAQFPHFFQELWNMEYRCKFADGHHFLAN